MGNSRRFSFSLEAELACGLPGSAACTSIDEAQQVVRGILTHVAPRWIVKAEFSHAARERLLGTGLFHGDQLSWLAKRLDRDGVVFVEPWVDRIAEIGLQWEVPAFPQRPQLVGVTGLTTATDGRYLGSLFLGLPAEPWHAEAVHTTRIAAERLQAQGYLGPLGIDAMRYRDGTGERTRPLQDVNARWTMGRLSLGWQRILEAPAVREELGSSLALAGGIQGTAWRRLARDIVHEETTHGAAQIRPALGSVGATRLDTPQGDSLLVVPVTPETLGGRPLTHAACIELRWRTPQ